MKNNKIELSAQNLSAGYDGKTIVSDVNITIPQNKISVILGANGCGKSTLLKTFAKLLKPEQGSILLDGEERVEFNHILFLFQCRQSRWRRR